MWNLLAGYSGMVSLGQQMFVGVGGYTLAVLSMYYGVPIFFSGEEGLIIVAGNTELGDTKPSACGVEFTDRHYARTELEAKRVSHPPAHVRKN